MKPRIRVYESGYLVLMNGKELLDQGMTSEWSIALQETHKSNAKVVAGVSWDLIRQMHITRASLIANPFALN